MADIPKEIFEWCLQNSNILTIKNKYNHKTLLHHVIEKRNDEIISALIARGADIHAKDDQDRTPLHLAVKFKLAKDIF